MPNFWSKIFPFTKHSGLCFSQVGGRGGLDSNFFQGCQISGQKFFPLPSALDSVFRSGFSGGRMLERLETTLWPVAVNVSFLQRNTCWFAVDNKTYKSNNFGLMENTGNGFGPILCVRLRHYWLNTKLWHKRWRKRRRYGLFRHTDNDPVTVNVKFWVA